MQKAEGLVLRLAVLSRLLLVTLIVIWRFLLPPYDSSAQLNPSCLSSISTAGDALPSDAADRVLWPRVGAAIEGSVVWDGVYFVRISECGYEYEQTYAFLPLLPISIALVSRSVFAPLIPVIGYRAVLALSGYVLNNLASVIAAVYFYKLSNLILKDSKASLLASVLFCFNPSSVFYSSIYSESLYALSSLSGIFYLFSDSNTVSMLLLGVSGAARSNGAINAGYFCFKALCQAYDAITQKRTIRHAVQVIIGGVASSFCLFVPFAVFQTYGYYNICVSSASDVLSPWCKSRVPNLYGYLQSHYWGVGFLRYFQVKQLPNFLLASPILAISIASIIYYASLVQQTLRSLRMKSRKASNAMPYPLGECRTRKFVSSSNNSSSSKDLKGNPMYPRRKNENLYKKLDSFIDVKQGYGSLLVLPFILHLGFMTFMALFVMHVQVFKNIRGTSLCRTCGEEELCGQLCHTSSHEIYETKYYMGLDNLSTIPAPDREIMWGRFEAHFSWPPEETYQIQEAWESTLTHRLTHIWSNERKDALNRVKSANLADTRGHSPTWLAPNCWDGLLIRWLSEEFQKVSKTAATNRATLKEGEIIHHSGGSISFASHEERMEKELSRPPTKTEVFLRTHTRKGSTQYVDNKSRAVVEKYDALISVKFGADIDLTQRPFDQDL